MKILLCLLLCITLLHTINAQTLEKLWTSDSLLKVPESVLVHKKVLFVSNIDGASGAKDGKGFISKLNPNGSIIELEWIKGLNAPKGMATFKGFLYVADLDAIVVVNQKSGMIVKRIEVEGAKFLNDVTVDGKGTIYFSDSETGIIHKMEDEKKPEPFITGRTRPNGVLWYQEKLYFVDAGSLFSFQNGTVTQIATGMEKSTDGIEPVDDQNLLVSSWIGTLYFVNLNGTVKELLNTKEQKINCADIGYNRKKKIVYAPTFNDNRVVAYKLKLK